MIVRVAGAVALVVPLTVPLVVAAAVLSGRLHGSGGSIRVGSHQICCLFPSKSLLIVVNDNRLYYLILKIEIPLATYALL